MGFTDPAAVSDDWGGVRELATHYVQLMSREQSLVLTFSVDIHTEDFSRMKWLPCWRSKIKEWSL